MTVAGFFLCRGQCRGRDPDEEHCGATPLELLFGLTFAVALSLVGHQVAHMSRAGTRLRVETANGELIGRIDEHACPDWTLTINADGSLGYTEDED